MRTPRGDSRLEGLIEGRAAIGVQIGVGVAIAAAAIAAAHLLSRRRLIQSDDDEVVEKAPPRSPPTLIGMAWPPLFMALTMSGLRIWNAPPSRRRSRALTLWGLAQALNGLWMALGPRALGGRVTAAVAAAGASGAYAWEAHRLYSPHDEPYGGPQSWRGIAGALSERLRRRTAAHHTLH